MCSARTNFPLVFSELLLLQPEGKLACLHAEEGRLGAGTPGGAWGIGESEEGRAEARKGTGGVEVKEKVGEGLWRSRGRGWGTVTGAWEKR